MALYGLTMPEPVAVNTGIIDNKIVQAGVRNNANMIHGLWMRSIKLLIWLHVFALAWYHYKNPFKAYTAVKKLKALRAGIRGNHKPLKYIHANGKYYYTFSTPGFPSAAFNRYLLNNLKRIDDSNDESILDTLIIGITKKCGYRCEHCFEWEALNKPETLSRENLLTIVKNFQKQGITQLQLSGGEPVNRYEDILYLLQHISKGTDVWLYTSGYHFTKEKAKALRESGLTGIAVSLDHWTPGLHNHFRGKHNAFEWVEKAVANARENNLLVCLSLCATKEFTAKDNLDQYARLARQWGVSFIQVLEPRAVGHYAGRDVSLNEKQIQLLEDFYIRYNYDKEFISYPVIVYHGFYSRHIGCGGGGKHYVYVDTDGDVHNCPFCQAKIFSALSDDISKGIASMRNKGCGVFKVQFQKQQC